MVATTHCRHTTLWKPGSFTGLMALYESNHLRLERLLGGVMPEPGECLVSSAHDDIDLYLDGIEWSRYTTTLRLTYLLDDDGTPVADPDMAIRVYHDAHLVEAMQCGGRPRHPVLRPFQPGQGSELQRRWARNLMLNKWLEYCNDCGHRFGPVILPRFEPVQLGLR